MANNEDSKRRPGDTRPTRPVLREGIVPSADADDGSSASADEQDAATTASVPDESLDRDAETEEDETALPPMYAVADTDEQRSSQPTKKVIFRRPRKKDDR